jgi:hypothetical protein
MSLAQRGGASHTRVTLIKMVWLILGNDMCGRTSRIDMLADVYVEVSHVKGVRRDC